MTDDTEVLGREEAGREAALEEARIYECGNSVYRLARALGYEPGADAGSRGAVEIMNEAAARIEALEAERKENERLREVLRDLHTAAGGALRAMYNEWHSAPKRDMKDEYEDLKTASQIARRALEESDEA